MTKADSDALGEPGDGQRCSAEGSASGEKANERLGVRLKRELGRIKSNPRKS